MFGYCCKCDGVRGGSSPWFALRSTAFWLAAAAICLGAAGVSLLLPLADALASPASVVFRGASDSKQVALTFDDNTNTSRAVATLRALREHQIPATLFLIGTAVEQTSAINQEILRGLSEGLFEVGDHSWSHRVLTGLSSTALAREIGASALAFQQATGGRTVPLFRPPYGETNARVAEVAGQKGYRYVVLWDVDPRDWAGGSAAAIADHVLSRVRSGSIVVMHLSAPNTAAAIPRIARGLRAKGYELVTVSTLLKGSRMFLDVDSATETGAAIAQMVTKGFMSGYDGNYFGPGDLITRAQVAKVATLVGGLHTSTVENVSNPSFVDVPVRRDSTGQVLAYPFDFVEEAARAGLVVGSIAPDGRLMFSPTQPVRRLHLAQLLARMLRQLKHCGAQESGSAALAYEAGNNWFTDVPEYARADVALVVRYGVMNGYSASSFRPWEYAKRGQVALAMSRYLAVPQATVQAGSW
ncbi:MAG: polysaccharide deacetylase family protein [Thermoleophilia bacterium]|nr:polysaccharide deacetylase family protein [Thermoleophilia bacterium]